MIRIAKAIKMPETRGGGRPIIYPWSEMEIGDSFECRFPFAAAYSASLRLTPKKFSVRKYGDGYRCWRIK